MASPVCCVERVRIPEPRKRRRLGLEPILNRYAWLRDRFVQSVVGGTSRDVVADSCGASRVGTHGLDSLHNSGFGFSPAES